MNPKYQKVISDIEKAEKKKSEIEGQLKELYDKKTELENNEIINTVRSMVMDKDQIIVMNLCGRGDKDVFTVGQALGVEL